LVVGIDILFENSVRSFFIMIIPEALKRGDTIGICSPSSPIAALCPRRFQRGITELEKMGFKVVVAKNALNNDGYMAGTIEERVADLNELFSNKEVKAIITTIGGTCSHQLLEEIDYSIISSNPKIFMGYSDITALHAAFVKKAGLVTYLGPAILPQFGEYGGLLSFTKKHFEATLINGERVALDSSETYVEEQLYWDENDDRVRIQIPHKGMQGLKKGNATGKVVAANMSTLLLLAGTEYFPDMKQAILCLEDDENESPSFIDRSFTQLRHLGVYDKIAGMVVGRFREKNGFEERQLEQIILSSTRGYSFPIVVGADFGHSDPMYILPNGVVASLQVEQNCTFVLREAAVLLSEKIV
jgi:muramoyltetrapeptide carboxypeptidase